MNPNVYSDLVVRGASISISRTLAGLAIEEANLASRLVDDAKRASSSVDDIRSVIEDRLYVLARSLQEIDENDERENEVDAIDASAELASLVSRLVAAKRDRVAADRDSRIALDNAIRLARASDLDPDAFPPEIDDIDFLADDLVSRETIDGVATAIEIAIQLQL